VNDLVDAFLKNATEDGDPEHIVQVLEQLQRITVPLFALYVLLEAKKHEDHDTDCTVLADLPKAIELFISEFSDDVRTHVEINLLANGISLTKTQNQKTYEEIMQKLKQAE
jgi:hypothetical protein